MRILLLFSPKRAKGTSGMRYYIAKTCIAEENTQEEVINSLLEEMKEREIQKGKEEERKFLLEKLKEVLRKSGLDEDTQTSFYDAFVATLPLI